MTAAPAKSRFPRSVTLGVARELCAILKPCTEALMAVGSLRRRKENVGDLELLFIPKKAPIQDPDDMLPRTLLVDETEQAIFGLLSDGVLTKRPKGNGTTTWGEQIKLAVHVKSGLPVDLFAATPGNWWNLVVCRTGSAAHNIKIAERAKARGYHWNPYGAGFFDRHGSRIRRVTSERDLFDALDLDYLEPWERI